MSDKPLFMSPQHVEVLNARLSTAPEVRELCASFEGDLCLLYELNDGPGSETTYWRTDFSRSDGIRFSLERGHGLPDVLISGSYWDIMEANQGRGALPMPKGDATRIARIMSILSSAEVRQCAVPVDFPKRML